MRFDRARTAGPFQFNSFCQRSACGSPRAAGGPELCPPLSRPTGFSLPRIGVAGLLLFLQLAVAPSAQPADDWLAPAAIAVAHAGNTLFLAGAQTPCALEFDLARGSVSRRFPLPATVTSIAAGQHRLYAVCPGPRSDIYELDPVSGRVLSKMQTGHTGVSPVLSQDQRSLFVCLRFDNQVAEIDLSTRREVRRMNVGREPVSAALTPDARFLLVAHHLPAPKPTSAYVGGSLGVVDLQSHTMAAELELPNGSTLARQIRLSPDGKHAVITHNLAHYQVPTTQLERGWMNTAAITLVDVAAMQLADTVVLDELDRGAANPWAVAWSRDGQRLFVTHAGTHELSVIDFPGLLRKLSGLKAAKPSERLSPAEDLSFLAGLRERIKLSGNGPRSIAVSQDMVCVAGYFSDTMEILDTTSRRFGLRCVELHPPGAVSVRRKGERVFNDASICFQGWQSCASCHSEDARVDGLNWDLLNDGLGNPKNSKSLLLAFSTPPAMSLGVRYSASQAVRAGLRHILFTPPTEDLATPMDEWLKSLQPTPSPYLNDGKLSPAARRGLKLFKSSKTGCASCHPPGLFTDLKAYDVATSSAAHPPASEFDTPSLLELWRTAPYLHDGSAPTLRDLLTTRNPGDQHGSTSGLSSSQIDDLVAYLLSL